ncbi:MAG: M14 family zinc carboxypeptidase [Ginsengibacter sp.]
MKSFGCFLIILFFVFPSAAQLTPFEKSNGKESATYFQAIQFYKELAKASTKIRIKKMGSTDAGYALHLVMISNDGKFDPMTWHKEKKVVILVNNGIHPGEPDGIDASLLLVRDIVTQKIKIPDHVVLAVIPIYNIGGSLNRNRTSRANQNGPAEYGFRGNSQNLDLNRDFTKCDTKEAHSFTALFHWLDPDIMVDTHVSDGADYQHTMSLLTTQYNKLGDDLGSWLKNTFEPELYHKMSEKGWDMVPYVNFETAKPDSGMLQFYDPPRYSSGYASMFQTIGFMPETHMLKSFEQRVKSTFALLQVIIQQAGINANDLVAKKKAARVAVQTGDKFPLAWKPDSSLYSMITFAGYEQAFKTSEATGKQMMFYDHSKPFSKQVKFFNVFTPENIVHKPDAYIIPQGWHDVVDLLKLNGVRVSELMRDTTIEVSAFHIDELKSLPRAYEKHHKNYDVKGNWTLQKIKFLKGDFIIHLNQASNRYCIEMLEPTGDDSFFAWNFFDAVLQQKEGYSDYRWEEVAAEVLRKDPELRKKLSERKKGDSSFEKNPSAQLEFIYKNSPYYEPVHLRYPVFRVERQ